MTASVAMAGCYLPRSAEAAKVRPDGERWAGRQDYRKMFDKAKLDAGFIETTTHARSRRSSTCTPRSP